VFHRVIPGFVIQPGDGQYGKKASLDAAVEWAPVARGQVIEDEKVQGDYVRGPSRWANAGPNTMAASSSFCHQDLTGKLRRTTPLRPGSPRAWIVVDQIVNARADGRESARRSVAMTAVTVHEA